MPKFSTILLDNEEKVIRVIDDQLLFLKKGDIFSVVDHSIDGETKFTEIIKEFGVIDRPKTKVNIGNNGESTTTEVRLKVEQINSDLKFHPSE